MKILAITICFILFFSVFIVSVCSHSHHIQIQRKFSFGHNENQCRSEYSFQENKDLRQELIVLIKPDSLRRNFKFLKLFSLFKSNLDDPYLTNAEPFGFDTISYSQQKSNQVNQLLAVVKIE